MLVAGLSNAGKSTFADFLERHAFASHIPLDKYFRSVPKGEVFLNWVQAPESIDWQLLDEQLEILQRGDACYTPVIDAWGTGQRVADGGKRAHANSKLIRPAARYVVPGCLSFEYRGEHQIASRVFINTSLHKVAERVARMEVQEVELEGMLSEALTPSFTQILDYKTLADYVFSGEANEFEMLKYLEQLTAGLSQA